MALSKPSSFDPLERPARFRDSVDEKHVCFYCGEVLLRPVQAQCGHRYCSSCKEELVAEDKDRCCIGKDDDCSESPLLKVFIDNGTARDLSKLLVHCPNQSAGCQATPTWKNLTVHVETCEFSENPCPSKYCKFVGTKEALCLHLQNDCVHALVSCDLCQREFSRQNIEEHMKLCSNLEHDCKYKKQGCTFRGSRDALLRHQKDSSLHFDMLVKHEDEMEKKLDCIEMELKRSNKEKEEFQRQLLDMCNEINSMNQSSTQRINKQQKVLASCAEKINAAESTISRMPSAESLEAQNKVIRDLQDVSRMLNGRMEHLEHAANSKSTSASGSHISAMENTVSRLERQLAEYEIRFRCIETASFNGTLIWKIANYSRRKQDAIQSKTLSLYSQPFYTSPFGYKMCARVYLNGDGIGAMTHMSLFFVIMKGEYDNLLQWPFRHKVSLTLLDQSGNNRNITDTFRPDPTSSSFRKPVGDMNIASGCPLFTAQATVESANYIKDDTIFIKVDVEKADIKHP